MQSPCAGDIHSQCVRTGPGLHQCKCLPGYRKMFGKCVEYNPCTDREKPVCGSKATCIHTGPGTHKCVCNPGYRMRNNKCAEINACDSKPCDRNALCQRTGPGTFKCKCKPGFVADGARCQEVDPCASNPCDSNSKCVKTGAGQFTCQCNVGFKKHGPTACVEIDNCASNPCDPNAKCTKTGPGTHTVCVTASASASSRMLASPYALRFLSLCVPELTFNPSICCGGVQCACRSGYSGDGQRGGSGCREVNRCLDNPSPCDANAECIKTGPGTHRCQCNKGFAGYVL